MTDDVFGQAAQLLLQARSEMQVGDDPGRTDALLRRSIELFRSARDADPAAVCANLGVALRMLAERTGDRTAAAAAVAEAQAAVAAEATSGRQLNLASALHVSFLLTGDGACLDDAVTAARDALRTCQDDLKLPSRLASLAGLLLDRGGRTGSGHDLDEALTLTTRAFAMPAPEDEFWSVVVNNHVLALRTAYERGFDPQLADLATEIGHAALAQLPDGSPGRVSTEGNLGLVHLARHKAGHHEQDLREAVAMLTSAAAHPGPLQHQWLANLVICRTEQYRRDPRPATFREIETSAHRALRALPAGDPRQGPLLVNLGGAHLERYERTGAPDALDEAERLHQEAVAATAGTPAHQTIAKAGLAVVWQRQAAAGSAGDRLTRAIELGRELAGHSFANADDRASSLSNLGLALAARFAADGRTETAEESARRLRDAVDALPAGHVARLAHLSNLAVFLLSWSEATGEEHVSVEAVEVARAAADAAGDDPDRAGYLANLGGALWRLYVRTQDPAALEQGVLAARAALSATPAGHPDRPMYLSNLSGLLARQADNGRHETLMREAVELAREAVERTEPGHPDRAMRMSNLSLTLRYLGRHYGVVDALDDAVQVGYDALAATPDTHPAQPGRMSNLAATLLARNTRDPSGPDRTAAVNLFAAVAGHDLGPVTLRIQAAAQAGALCAEDNRWAQATDHLGLGVELMQRLATHYTVRSDEEHDLSRFAQLSADAAACAIHLGDLRRALDLIEAGTGVMLSRTLALRSDVDDLRSHHPEVASRLDQLTAAVAAGQTPGTGIAGATLHGFDRRGADSAWRDLLHEIRQLAGFERFQTPPSGPELRRLAEPGPIVIVTTSRYRCDALLVTADHDVRLVPLPNLAHADVVAASESLLTTDPTEDPGLLQDMLGWLWDTVAAPVLDALPEAPAQTSRLWWMPVGVIALLPLHAAGHRGGPYVDDRAVCSYTPTLGSLRHHRLRPHGADVRALVVEAPQGSVPLPAARREAALVAKILAGCVTRTSGQEKTLAALTSHGWVHFSGHAETDLQQPSRSNLQLADAPLSVVDLATHDVAGEVAVLSACSSNRTRADLATEAVHVAAAFHLAGFRQVVGTLWPVGDIVSLRLAGHLYPAVLEEGALRPQRLPAALRDATRALRARWPDRPAAWASYVHMGC
ncbi:CHAT domain-containing protein [Actinoplanes sp. HUAS TT8]|uniref:CHAT domain-containing protein n=1 Tax=Actinoplanes sp. HUAS TT8 TaxID=3447453 RepID=UPI003F522394